MAYNQSAGLFQRFPFLGIALHAQNARDIGPPVWKNSIWNINSEFTKIRRARAQVNMRVGLANLYLLRKLLMAA